jgi:acyl-coenzyme A thioesterase PaaI-like protein
MARLHPWKLALINLWPPFLGAGIRVRILGRDPLAFESRLRLRWSNRNYVGTHFGGSLYAMTDPFFMLILVEALGPGYLVWDKAATIRYRRPGRGLVRARFEIASARIAELASEAAARGRVDATFHAEVRDAADELVAEVDKVVHIRRRDERS